MNETGTTDEIALAEAMFKEGNKYLQTGQLEEAKFNYELSVRLYQKNGEEAYQKQLTNVVLHMYLLLYIVPKQYNNGIEAYKGFINLVSQEAEAKALIPHALWGLGYCHQKLGNTEAAADNYKKSKALCASIESTDYVQLIKSL